MAVHTAYSTRNANFPTANARDTMPDNGSISCPEVEQRLLTACKTIRALPDRDRRLFEVHTLWPEVVREITDAYGYTEIAYPRFRPSPADVSDCLTALEWARCLERKQFRFIWWRSYGLSFRRIGDHIHRSDESARRYYRDAMLSCWLYANGRTLQNVVGVASKHHIFG
jgi:hypothetical protein